MQRDIEYSRARNLHVWSDSERATSFVQAVMDKLIPNNKELKPVERNTIKRNLSNLILDLFHCWSVDPAMSIGVPMSNSRYKTKSIYNGLGISSGIIELVNQLKKDGYIGSHKGSHKDERDTRIWAEEPLIEWFKQSGLTTDELVFHKGRQSIVLRDKKKKDKKKKDKDYRDTAATRRMRDVLTAYNDLLDRTFIDIFSLNQPTVIHEMKDKKKKPKEGWNKKPQKVKAQSDKPTFTRISQEQKFVRRIFNNGSFKEGGRFYGPFWTLIPKRYRNDIRIDGFPTIELDFSGLHIVLAYREKKLNYNWNNGNDPYLVEVKGVDDAALARKIGKTLLLIALNAKNDKAAINAARNQFEEDELGSFDYDVLKDVLTKLKDKHSDIADLIASNAGIKLQLIDSTIVEKLVQRFTEEGIHILCIHDSFIVKERYKELLRTRMSEAIKEIAGVEEPKLKQEGIGLYELLDDLNDKVKPNSKMDIGDKMKAMVQSETKGYTNRRSEFDNRMNKDR